MNVMTGLDHVEILVPDLAEAIRFYCDGLGLRRKRVTESSAVLYMPDDTVIELTGGATREHDASGITHICMTTYDIDDAFRRALAFGATPSRPKYPAPVDNGAFRLAFVYAPGGEEVEFWQLKGERWAAKAPEGQYVRHLAHVALTVADVPAAVAFYEALGARMRSDWGKGCALTLPDGREIELFPGGEQTPAQHKAIKHFCALTGNADAALEAAIAQGGKLMLAPNNYDSVRFCFCYGLAGEMIEFFQVCPERKGEVFDAFPAAIPGGFFG